MLQELLLSMIFAVIITVITLEVMVKFFEWRFLNKAESIFMLFECIYPMLEDDFNNDNSMKVTVRFEHGRCKIKFHDAAEACVKFEMIVLRSFKSYQIVEYIMSLYGKDMEGSEMQECRVELEKLCCEVRALVNKTQENKGGL